MKDDIKTILEEFLHAGWILLALLPIVIWDLNIWTGALSGLLFCLPRELIDQWPINHWADTIIDICAFVVGGVIAGAIA